MKSIKDLLPNKTVNVLVKICRKYNLSGYSNSKKEELINLIVQTINNPQVNETIKSLIKTNGTTALILKNLMDNGNEINYQKLREEVLKNRTSPTFRWYYKILIENFILFEDDLSEDDVIFLPKEFNKIAKNVIDKHIKEKETEEIEIIVEEDKESRSITTIDQLLYSKKYTIVDSLREFLISYDLPISGNKSQLIERILYRSKIPILDTLGLLFGKNDLRELCRDLDLLVSGNKETLIERILTKLPLAEPPISEIKPKVKTRQKPSEQPSKKAELKTMASGKAQDTIQIQIKKERKLKEKPLNKLIYDLLDKIPLPISKIKNTDNFEIIFFPILTMKIQSEEEYKGINLIEGIKKTNEPMFKAEKKEEKVGISVWYFENKNNKKMNELKARILDYKNTYSKDLIFYIFDRNNKINPEDIELIKKQVGLVYKTGRSFVQE